MLPRLRICGNSVSLFKFPKFKLLSTTLSAANSIHQSILIPAEESLLLPVLQLKGLLKCQTRKSLIRSIVSEERKEQIIDSGIRKDCPLFLFNARLVVKNECSPLPVCHPSSYLIVAIHFHFSLLQAEGNKNWIGKILKQVGQSGCFQSALV